MNEQVLIESKNWVGDLFKVTESRVIYGEKSFLIKNLDRVELNVIWPSKKPNFIQAFFTPEIQAGYVQIVAKYQGEKVVLLHVFTAHAGICRSTDETIQKHLATMSEVEPIYKRYIEVINECILKHHQQGQ